jgi:hypothetical protein
MTRVSIIAVFLLGIVLAQSGPKLEPFVADALPETIKPNPIPEGMTDDPVLPAGAVMIRTCLPSLKNLQIPTDASKAKPDPAISKRIQAIVDADQAARQKPLDDKAVFEDQKRREALLPLIPRAVTAIDFANIALVFQHGDCVPLFMLANKMATLAMKLTPTGQKLDSRYEDPYWLYAATLDRALKTSSKAQKFGTQYTSGGNGECYRLYLVDPRTSDAERAKYHVPSLQKAIARAKELSPPNCKKPTK